MKILQVTFQNLNSLRGEHTIDFTQEPLASAGLFAITGPTGSGKSTILDAITLALFGRAARYGSAPSPEDMMSRHCGECRADVRFEVPKGTYRAEWQLRRARGKSEGKMQAAKRAVYDASEQPLTQQTRDTESLIEELVGLDYTRFLRSALLAQGDFAQFLKADPKERAALLESLTGTTIYSELGRLAHEEAGKRKQHLAEQEAAIKAIPIMEKEAREALEKQINDGNKQKPLLDKKLGSLSSTLTEANQLQESVRQEQTNSVESARLAESRKKMEPELERLQLHRLTIPFQAELATYEQVERDLKAGTEDWIAARKTHATTLEKSGICLTRFNERLIEDAKGVEESIEKSEKSLEALMQSRQEIQKWLDLHQQDAKLGAMVTSLSVELAELKSQRGAIGADWNRLRTKLTPLGEDNMGTLPASPAELTLPSLKRIVAHLNTALAERIDEAVKAREESMKERSLCELNLQNARKVAGMEQHRAELKDGDPCPLCGSLHHPYLEGKLPSFPFAELEKKLKEANEAWEHRKKVTEVLEDLRSVLAGETDSLQSRLEDIETRLAALKRELAPLKMTVPDSGREDTLARELKSRAEGYAAKTREADKAVKEIEVLKQNRKGLLTRLEETKKKQARLTKVSLPERDPEMDESVIGSVTLSVPEPIEAIESLWEKLNTQLTIDSTTLHQRAGYVMVKRKEFAAMEDKMTTRLKASRFVSVEALKKAHLQDQTATRIEQGEKQLSDAEKAVQIQLEALGKQIANLRKKKIPEGEQLKELKQTLKELSDEHEALVRNLGSWTHAIDQDDKNRKKLEREKKRIAKELDQMRIWERLKGLIGSHDGSRFRQFAQGLSLQLLIRYANRQMARLNDRYRMQRSNEQELEIEILDLHQAGVARPMQSLSGGESFLASLALALGLSEIAGRKVRIDSLFIDEGFGSLDSDTLDLAISALESLRQENKNIGVISHVDLLKERIATQIQVEKHPGGVSSIKLTA